MIDSGHFQLDTLGNVSRRGYGFHQTYDSLVIAYQARQRYTEFEIPIMMRYSVMKNFSVLGGLNINFSKVLQLTETRQQYTGLQLFDTLVQQSTPLSGASLQAYYNSRFAHSSPLYTPDAVAAYQNPTTNPLRFGYILGASYTAGNRLMVDVMIQQSLSKQTYIPNTEVRSIYNQPYVRISLGYKLYIAKPKAARP